MRKKTLILVIFLLMTISCSNSSNEQKQVHLFMKDYQSYREKPSLRDLNKLFLKDAELIYKTNDKKSKCPPEGCIFKTDINYSKDLIKQVESGTVSIVTSNINTHTIYPEKNYLAIVKSQFNQKVLRNKKSTIKADVDETLYLQLIDNKIKIAKAEITFH